MPLAQAEKLAVLVYERLSAAWEKYGDLASAPEGPDVDGDCV